MFREIVINADPSEMRVAVLEDATLVEFLVERQEERRRVGDIYKGRVDKVLPGMDAAFIEIGLEKAAFIHASDMLASSLGLEGFDLDEDEVEPARRRPDLPIQDLLEKGQEILVQLVKEPIGTKGAKVSGRLSLPGRFLVLMPGLSRIGVSRKIANSEERLRLKKILKELKPRNAGLICRTAAEGLSKKDLAQDVRFLAGLWEELEKEALEQPAPAVIHRDIGMATGLIRDIFTEQVGRVTVDSKDVYKEILRYLQVVAPELKTRVKLYTGEGPIFDEYGIEGEIEKSFEHKVWLRKGGYIVIESTEAMVTIDVNTGRFTGKRSQEETILKTNLEAAKEVARQLRLRDLGGIIVIDFIDMEIEGNRRALVDAFRAALRGDRARTKVYPPSELGLVEMTRQRVRQSLHSYFSEECPACHGVGRILSLPSAAMKLERSLRRVGAHSKEKDIQIQIHPDLAVFVLDRRGHRLEALERKYGFRLDLREDPRLRRDEVRIYFRRLKKDVTAEFQG
ncbi:MAG: Rne/Rng family ribonuclease [Candidatus Eisenbacteria bacterium]|uniref:Ribonuclease G n=1 Tax=Eiseniibacteriota bacterium TaxID=2212470 RepID=A0A937X9U1_UNCEI|nr:Rne/Rng family ribonuclease [Candidatus Eisenbacteria bacterium]